MRLVWHVVALGVVSGSLGCHRARPSRGGGETRVTSATARPAEGARGARKVNPADVSLPRGYVIEVVAEGLTYPTGVTFDERGGVYVVESGYSYGEDFTKPRLVQIIDGKLREIASGGNGPWNGVTYRDDAFYVAEGGVREGGKILCIARDGTTRALVEGSPSQGDHQTNGPIFGPDGKLYFSQGSLTNAGVVGPDNADMGWLRRNPELHEIPCKDVVVTGVAYPSRNPLTPDDGFVRTSAFAPYGVTLPAGARVPGTVPCNGAVMRVSPTGGAVELVAWGFRNPFGLAIAPDGRLYATDNGYDMRGSRLVFGAPDVLWEVKPGAWYGFPDYSAGQAVTSERFHPPQQEEPVKAALAEIPSKPPQPAAQLGVHSSSNGFDFSRNPSFGFVGEAFIAQFGDTTPASGKVLSPVGFRIVRADVGNGVIQDFASNRGDVTGPASMRESGGLERPIAARFDPSGGALYVVDFGVLTTLDGRYAPRRQTGVLWRIRREEGAKK
jgi:glucose/arabinose dehydrogenase